MNKLAVILDISAALILLGMFLAGAYEAIAFLNFHIPFTPNLPFITTIVRPWVATHRSLFIVLVALVVASIIWVSIHFYFK
jgi:hypothetical protein